MRLPLFRAARAKIMTSSDVQAEIDRHATLLTTARQDLALLDADRRDVLLGDDVAAIRAHEDRAAELRIAELRLTARLEALAEQAVEIAAAEAAAALELRRKDVETVSAAAAAWLQNEYPKAAQGLVTALAALREVEGEVAAVNLALAEAGRTDVDPIRGVQSRLSVFLGDGEGMNARAVLCAGSPVSMLSMIRLPNLAGGVEAPGWSAPEWS